MKQDFVFSLGISSESHELVRMYGYLYLTLKISGVLKISIQEKVVLGDTHMCVHVYAYPP